LTGHCGATRRDATARWRRRAPLRIRVSGNGSIGRRDAEHREAAFEEHLGRPRPQPPHNEMVIEDLNDDEAEAFLVAIRS
jgi:hypothetical protein